MAVPQLDELRRPALELLEERSQLTSISEVFELLAPRFNLTEEDLTEMLPSGTQRRWHNRVNWACYDLYRAGALDRPVKGKYQINARGGKILKEGPEVLTRTYLSQQSDAFAKFLTPQVKSGTESPSPTTKQLIDGTPEEQIDSAVQELGAGLRSEVLEALSQADRGRRQRW